MRIGTIAISILGLVTCSLGQLPDYVGSHDRFWKHHKVEKTLVIDGVEHYDNIESCIHDELSQEDRQKLSVISEERRVGKMLMDTSPEKRKLIASSSQSDNADEGPVFFVEVIDAITPVHARAVQTLAACIRKFIPSMHESRAMYKEFELDEDQGLGGNNPTHLAPLVGIFLPDVKDEIIRTIQLAYEAAGWKGLLTDRDHDAFSNVGKIRTRIHPEPKDLGFRASEHLTYTNFPLLAHHHDGADTAYTCNFAFSDPDDYEGGFLYVIDKAGEKTHMKPSKFAASVFLGGMYLHGVTEITGGHREMFSSEMWYNPDLPVGSNLWSSTTTKMEAFITKCNELGQTAGNECNATLSDFQVDQATVDDESRLAPSLVDYFPTDVEPNYLVPKDSKVGELYNLFYRNVGEPLKNDEAFGIALPPELLQEFQTYIDKNGMLDHARRLIYEEEPFGNNEHRLYKLNDGMTWGCMGPRWGGMDMVWIDPADEQCFESILSVLRRGNFDVVLEAIGKEFDLDGLMVTGIGPIFLSYFEHDSEYKQVHADLREAKGSFYNVVVPLYIPEGGASLYVGDDDGDRVLPIQMRYDHGIVLGGGTFHGTAECDYREQRDVRLSVAIYLADVTEENIEDIAGDNTSLWPTEGDIDWFWSQRGRVWRYDDRSVSLKTDRGRGPLYVEDERADCWDKKDLCMSDPTGFRLECAETCEVYLQDKKYYETLGKMIANDRNVMEDFGDQVNHDVYEWDHPPFTLDYLAKDKEPNFLLPNISNVGELYPLHYRDTGRRLKNDEAFGIALPPELLQEFQTYIDKNGMLDHARHLIYEEEPFGNNEHRLYKLNDGMTWGCMGPRWGGMDMVWIDPADEQCFESILSVLRRGNFDVVLEAIGKEFDLDGLMVTGIGPIFLSYFEHDSEYKQVHADLREAKGSFYNVVVPLYIPEGGASLYVGDDDGDRVLPIQMRYDHGIVLGGGTFHGTAECDYREQRDVRLSVAIYLADVTEENIEDIAGDNTSLWPTEGDIDWFWSQRGRVWRYDDRSVSLKTDRGRGPLYVEDERADCWDKKDLCMSDPTGFRLECAETCEVYLQDKKYYETLGKMIANDERSFPELPVVQEVIVDKEL